MTKNRPNPIYLEREHPVRAILLEAALGREPSKAQLDAALNRNDAPEAVNLARFRRELAEAAAKVARTHSPAPGVSNYNAARRLADNYVIQFAGRMTDGEAAVTGLGDEAEALDAIAARMFGGAL